MAWTSVVRRDPSRTNAPPSSSSPFICPSVESLPSRQHPQRSVAVAVIDANALISSPTSTLFGLADRFVTVKEVLDEVRDPTSRFQLAALPIDVECLQPCDEVLRKVAQFARETGDLQSLSAVDLRLLALAYMLEEQLHGATHLRTKAPPLQVMQTKHIRERDLPGWGSNVQNIEEWEELSENADQNGNEESHILKMNNLSLDDLNADKSSNEVAEQSLHESKKETENRECLQEEIIQEVLDEEEWQPLSNSSVACITSDFPMQNVLLQIGLRVISPNGLQIHKLHRWVLKCEACRNVVSDVGRIFCPKCGNGGTLYKASVSIGPNGVTHTGRRRRLNIRGTKYSLPLPKGGRRGILENPILREDQLPKKMLRPKKKNVSLSDFSTFTDIFEVKTVGKQILQPPICEALAVFSGKRNPNMTLAIRRLGFFTPLIETSNTCISKALKVTESFDLPIRFHKWAKVHASAKLIVCKYHMKALNFQRSV